MLSFTPQERELKEVYRLLVSGIGPRPIALVSSVDAEGRVNLAPFSFFNAFGVNPPVVVFAPVRRLRDGSLKDTHRNLEATKECVVHNVTFDMVEQVNLCSVEFPTEVNEFEKSGLTPLPSTQVKAPRVAESPMHMECKLKELYPLGSEAGAGSLVICEIVAFHINEELLDDGAFKSREIDLVGRMGGEDYARAFGLSIFQVPRAAPPECLGMDGLPDHLINSPVFNSNHKARFAHATKIPTLGVAERYVEEHRQESKENVNPAEIFEHHMERDNHKAALSALLNINNPDLDLLKERYERIAKTALENNQLDEAWMLVVYAGHVHDEQG